MDVLVKFLHFFHYARPSSQIIPIPHYCMTKLPAFLSATDHAEAHVQHEEEFFIA